MTQAPRKSSSEIILNGIIFEPVRERYYSLHSCQSTLLEHGLLGEAPTQPQDKTDRLSKRLIGTHDAFILNYLTKHVHAELNAYRTMSSTIDLAQLLETQPVKIKALPSMALHILRQKLCKATKTGTKADVAIWIIMRDNSVVELGVDRDKQDIAWLGFDHGSSIVFYINES